MKTVYAMVAMLALTFSAKAGVIATQFSYPINPWATNCNGYWSTCNIPDEWHLGVDVVAPAGTAVYASAVGTVKHTALRTGYGHVVIIEHTLSNGEVVCSVSGHLNPNIQVTVGQSVVGGEIIGYLGAFNENGGYVPHLHFGINKGIYRGDFAPGCSSGSWWYGGYTSCYSDQSLWYDPIEFIAAHGGNSFLGHLSNGNVQQVFIDCYNRNGGANKVGVPFDDGAGVYVHNWLPFRYLVQNFRNAKGEESAIIYDPLYGSQAYLISGKFWWQYRAGRGGRGGPDIPMGDGTTLGVPRTDAFFGLQIFTGGHFLAGSVELYRPDGTLVEIFQPTAATSALTLSGKAMSSNQNTITFYGGLLADKYVILQNGQKVGETTLQEFSIIGLHPGDVSTYKVQAWSNTLGVIDESNEVTILSPGEVGSLTALVMPDGPNAAVIQVKNTLNDSEFYAVYRGGVLVAKIAGNAFSDFPLEPNKKYTYQVEAITFSGLVRDWSNPVTVTTEPAPLPPPTSDQVPTLIQLRLSPVMQFNTGQQVVPTVYDQNGNVMTGVELLYCSSNSSMGVILPELGWLWGNGLGQTEIWAELKNNRFVRSERITVNVVPEYLDEPVVSPAYPSATFLQQDYPVEILTPTPLVGSFYVTPACTLTNITSSPQSFEGPAFEFIDSQGNSLGVSSYLGGTQTLQPGETRRFVLQTWFSFGLGSFYARPVVKPVGSGYNAWLVVDKTAPGINSQTAIQVFSSSDLRAELKQWYFEPVLNQDGKLLGDSVVVYDMLTNDGDLNITSPFRVTVVLTGNGVNLTRSQTVNSLAQGYPAHRYFDFGELAAGVYRMELFIDPDNVVAEYNEADNRSTMLVEVLPAPKPNATMTINLPSTARVGNVVAGTALISNLGQAATGLIDYRITDGVTVITGTVGSIAVSGSMSIAFNLPLNREGNIVVIATADPSNKIAESNESDNDGLTTVTVQPALKPDLAISSLVASPNSFNLGGTTTITVMVRESNNVTVSASVLRLNLGGTAVRINIPAITASGSYQFNYVYKPSTVGSQTVTATVDVDNVVVENSEVNNFASTTLTVKQPPVSELHRRSTSYSGSRWTKTVNYMVTVENTGQLAAGGFTVKVVVPEIGLVQTQNFTGLAAGVYGSKLFSFKTSYRGQLTFKVTIDSVNQVAESNEANNYFEERYAL